MTQLKNTSENCQQELNISLADLVESIYHDETFILETARRDADELDCVGTERIIRRLSQRFRLISRPSQ